MISRAYNYRNETGSHPELSIQATLSSSLGSPSYIQFEYLKILK